MEASILFYFLPTSTYLPRYSSQMSIHNVLFQFFCNTQSTSIMDTRNERSPETSLISFGEFLKPLSFWQLVLVLPPMVVGVGTFDGARYPDHLSDDLWPYPYIYTTQNMRMIYGIKDSRFFLFLQHWHNIFTDGHFGLDPRALPGRSVW